MGLDGTTNHEPGGMSLFETAQAPHRITLIGDSVLQFLSFAVSREALDRVRRTFLEDGIGDHKLLQSFAPDAVVPATLAAQAFVVSGGEAADTFADEWLPMPCLRHVAGVMPKPSADGPTNWVRARLVADGSNYRLVLAFDTWLADPASMPGTAQVSPTLDDARHGATFTFASDFSALENFIGEPWIDDWISIPPAAGSVAAPPRAMLRLAHFITLLAALKSASALPDVEISGSAAGRLGAPDEVRDVDLAVSFSDGACAAHLIDVAGFDGGVASAIVPLEMRDLDQPWMTHAGRQASAVAFSKPLFGREALSRVSGRTDAFAWPSLARVGREAESLSLRQPADAPRSGLRDVLESALDVTPNDAVWRLAGDGVSANTRLPFVGGPLLALLTETGERVAAGVGRTRATRARFSASALTALAMQELVVQAIAAVNPVDLRTAGVRRTPSRLRSIVVTLPDHMLPFERDLVHVRIRDGVALACDALRWPASMQPDVVIAPTRAQATQYAYLHNEIAHRLGGRAPAYLRLLAGPVRPAGTPVTIAALDLSAGGLALDISTVSTGDENHLALAAKISDTAGIGLADVAAAIARRVVVPALVRHLESARLAQAAALVTRMLQQSPTATGSADLFADRLRHNILLPAAFGLLALHHKSTFAGETLEVGTTLHALIGAHPDHVALQRLQNLAVAEGANATSLLDASIVTTAAEIRSIVAEILQPAVRAACRSIRRNRCSLLLLSGHPAMIGMLRDTALGEAATTPDRIVDMTTYRFSAWVGRQLDLAAAQAAGSSLASRHSGATVPLQTALLQMVQFISIEAGSDRTPMFALDPKMSDHSADRTHTFIFDGGPKIIGVSTIDAPHWPRRSMARLQVCDQDAARRAALPFAVTLALKPQATLSPDAFEIRSVRDARGRQLPPSVLELKIATTRALNVCIEDPPAMRARSGSLT